MEILLTVLMTWLSANFDLPAVHQQPDIKFVTHQEMVALRHGGSALNTASEIVALYDDRVRAILLSDRWTGDTPAELSVLVHELVHHVQNVAKFTYLCPEERETLAYAAQEKWLSLFGQSLLTAFEIDPLTLKIRTACM
jgi:hypothetical protein